MNYSELTYFEINKLVAERQGVGPIDSAKISDCGGLLFSNYKVYNPCNNPSDAWPIILEIWHKLFEDVNEGYGLGLTLWQSVINKYDCGELRSAMIVYLMMGDE